MSWEKPPFHVDETMHATFFHVNVSIILIVDGTQSLLCSIGFVYLNPHGGQ